MTHEAPPRHRRRLLERGLLGALALVLAVVGAWVERPVLPGGWHDDGVYLLLGRALATGEGFRYVGVPGSPPAAKFPPGYPLVVAASWRLSGGDVDGAARLAALVNLLAVVASAVLLARFALRRLRLPLAWSLAVGLGYGLLLDPWRFALLTLSESLAILATLATVDLATRWEQDEGGQGRKGATALAAFAVAVHLRSAVLPVGAAMALSEVSHRRFRRGLAMGAAVAAVALPWMVVSAFRSGAIPTVLRDLLGGYGGWLGGVASSPGDFLGGRPSQVGLVVQELASVLAPWGAGAPAWVAWGSIALLLCLAAAGAREVWRNSRTAVLVTAGMVVQALLWPFADRRLLLPLVPWTLLLVLAGMYSVARRGDWAGKVVTPLTMLWLAALSFPLLHAATAGEGAGAAFRGREVATAAAVAAVGDWVPPGRLVGAPELWAIIHLRTGHPVVPSARFHAVRDGVARAGTPAEQFRVWAVTDPYALVAEGGIHREALDRMHEVCGPGSWSVPTGGFGFLLVRLEWDESCRRALLPGWGEPTP